MSTVQQSFIPESPWVYFKLYTRKKTADDLLVTTIALILEKLKKEHVIKKWFFIWYSDPDFHLRIRLLAKDTQNTGEIIQLFYQKLDQRNKFRLVWKIQLDTYNRELEQYGEQLVEEAESVFFADSECILSILKNLNGNENYRWMIALKLIDELLSDFGLNTEAKQRLMEDVSEACKTEFGFNEFNAKHFNTKFRENKKTIESVLNNSINEKAFISLFQPIKKRTKRLKPIAEQIKIKSKKENNKVNELLKSYLHLMLNRLFCSNSRIHELILYDFMFRYISVPLKMGRY